MRITINSSTLLGAVEKISLPVTGGKNVRARMCVLGKSKNTTSGAYTSLEAYDGSSTQVITYFFANIDEEKDIDIKVDAKSLINIVKVLSKQQQDFLIEIDGSTSYISAGNDAKVRLPIFDECTLISLGPDDKPYATIKVNKDQFFAALARGGYAHSTVSEAVNGIYIEYQNDELRVITSDGMRVASAITEAKKAAGQESGDLTAFLPTSIARGDIFDKDEIDIGFAAKRLVIKDKSTLIILNKQANKFAAESIKKMNIDVKATLIIPKKSMLKALEIVMLADEAKESPVQLIYDDKSKVISMVTAMGGAKAVLDGTCNGEFGEVSLSIEYLKDAVAVSGDKICIEYASETLPVKVSTENDSKNYSIICPVRKKVEPEKADK